MVDLVGLLREGSTGDGWECVHCAHVVKEGGEYEVAVVRESVGTVGVSEQRLVTDGVAV